MTTRILVSLLPTIFITLIRPAGVMAQADKSSSDLLADVKVAWGKREASIQSLNVQLTGKTVIPRAAIDGLNIRARKVSDKAAPPMTDVTYTSDYSFVMDNNKSKLEQRGRIWHLGKNELVATNRVTTYDGTNRVSLIRFEDTHPRGTVSKEDYNPVGDQLALWPMLASVRGTDPQYATKAYHLGSFSQAGWVMIDSKSYVEIVRPQNETQGAGKLVLDPQFGYSIRRLTAFDREGKLLMQIEAGPPVRQDAPANADVPLKWVATSFDKSGKMRQQDQVQVSQFLVNHAAVNRTTTVDLPPGAYMTDTADGDKHDFIVKADGTRRVVDASERGKSHAELFATEQPAGRWRWTRWVLYITGFLLIAVAAKRVFHGRGPRDIGVAS